MRHAPNYGLSQIGGYFLCEGHVLAETGLDQDVRLSRMDSYVITSFLTVHRGKHT